MAALILNQNGKPDLGTWGHDPLISAYNIILSFMHDKKVTYFKGTYGNYWTLVHIKLHPVLPLHRGPIFLTWMILVMSSIIHLVHVTLLASLDHLWFHFPGASSSPRCPFFWIGDIEDTSHWFGFQWVIPQPGKVLLQWTWHETLSPAIQSCTPTAEVFCIYSILLPSSSTTDKRELHAPVCY